MRVRTLLAVPAAALALAMATPASLPATAQATPPTTGFEGSGGLTWTTHQEELAFLEAVAAASPRVEVEVIGETEATGRPLHLVKIGEPAPHSLEAAQDMPVELHICSQHGNEPAGREACLIALRDLAFTDDPALVEQLAQQVTLFVPAANPDGREANTRANALGVDLNRNHLEVEQVETRAIGRVVRDWKPVMNMDHHEYGPVIPGVYDDDVLYLWPRNLNVYKPLRDLAYDFSVNHLNPCLLGQGYRADEYGLYSAGGQPAPDLDLQQSAGDWDDGISRNAAGLRHSMGILIESLSHDAGLLSDELVAPLQQRRVDSQVEVIWCTMEWMRDNGTAGYQVTRDSMASKAAEGSERSAPVYFDGQDEDTTVAGTADQPTVVADPPPCGYLVDQADSEFEFEEAADVHGLQTVTLDSGDVFVPMGQTAEPVVALLLDVRGKRHLIEGEALDDCATLVDAAAPSDGTPADEIAPAEPAPLPVTGGGAALAGLLGLGLALRLRRAA